MANLSYKAGVIMQSGDVPYQNLAYFNVSGFSNIQYLNFYGMNNGEFLGDKLYYLNLENNFGRGFWRGIPVLKNLELIGFFNAGKTELSDKNFNLSPNKDYNKTDGWYFETGFGFGNIFNIFRLNFVWRLNNYKVDNNFKILLFINNVNF